LVDLLVVFGTDLLFSDKHCAFQPDVDIKVAWPRWYKRAIEKSARQVPMSYNVLIDEAGTSGSPHEPVGIAAAVLLPQANHPSRPRCREGDP
jgi:hypothetical protein